ncbi:serine hydrolase domain-containing protein [Streptomyces sp. H27-C3]|uniref:serine hydrolase domain-containing protein n=1 Tax=Streptomyces sp. H27-C3 TaxID=3046305 RepID=UPI0024BB092D|nr:serine hydrolase domain-containing protein [Streptomyces sp. H27-C3]MDJ0466626.1 serine hydrolase domain-containing protein [Streptomyces sp. H27-C3]
MSAHQDTEPGLSLLIDAPDAQPALLHSGLASLEHGQPIGPDTAFNTGSVAKQITAHLTLLAARDELLRLDQPAADLLPRLKISDITVADLITHRSGLRDAESLLSLAGFRDLDHYTADDLRTLAYQQHQRALPHGAFLYSNTNYLLLAEILETVHRTPLPDLAHRDVFTPLGMHGTHFKADPRQVVPRAASAYQATDHGWQHTQGPATVPGSGSLWSTPGDLDRWLTHLHHTWQHQQLPWQDTLAYTPSDHTPYLYGPGLYASTRGDDAAVFHYGHEQGFSAAVHLESGGLRVLCLSNNTDAPADHVTAAVLENLRAHPSAGHGQVLAEAAKTRRPTRPTPPTRDESGPHTDMGTFTCDQAPGSLRLTRTTDTLHLWRRGTRDPLTRSGPDTYSGNGYTLTLPDSTDSVGSFTLDLKRAPGLQYIRQ